MRRERRAFSLLEVVLAVALVGGGVAVVLGLLPALLRNAVDSLATQTALRLADAIEVELRDSDGNFTERQFVAAREGVDLRRLSVESPARDQYFLVTVRPLAAGALSRAPLAVNVTVAWPYRRLTPEGLEPASPAGVRQSLRFNLGVRR